MLVSFDHVVTPATIDSLTAMAQNNPVPGLASPKKIPVIPQNTNVMVVPSEVTVLPMQSPCMGEQGSPSGSREETR